MSIPVTPPILIAPELREGLAEGQPVACLESAVVTHGLPEPYNTQAIWRAARAVRHENVIFGTIGVVRGKIKVGLSDDELRMLGDPAFKSRKIGVGDLAVAIAEKWSGGTTMAATAWIASRVGVKVVVTGGIGGVHRAPYNDESGDLTILSQAPVAVVCTGPKAVCDLSLTLEKLETLCVPVIGIRTDELPGFYYNDTGIFLDLSVEDEASGARVFRAHRALERKGGILFVSRLPEDASLDAGIVEKAIENAYEKASVEKIKGKNLTPFLLEKLRSELGLTAVHTNLSLLETNAAVGARLARYLARDIPGKKQAPEGA